MPHTAQLWKHDAIAIGKCKYFDEKQRLCEKMASQKNNPINTKNTSINEPLQKIEASLAIKAKNAT